MGTPSPSTGGDGQSLADTLIAFVSNWDVDFEIYTMHPDGSNIKQLTENTDRDELPAWSPDDPRLAF